MGVAVLQRERWAVKMAVVVVVVVGLLAMASPTMQLNVKEPLRGTVQKSSSEDPRAIGLIVTAICCEKALNESGIFHVNSSVELLGRTFVLGKIHGADIVYVRSASRPAANLGITLQIMADNFKLGGVILLGLGLALTDSLSVGSVVIPSLIGSTGVWTWQPFQATKEGPLKFGDFNFPYPGDNLLGSVKYKKSQIYIHEEVKESFWIPVTAEWLQVASRIQVDSVEVFHGLKLASADVHLDNEKFYRRFLNLIFGASISDTTSITGALGAYSNNLRLLVVRGVSGNDTDMVAANAMKVVDRFIYLISVPPASS
ncbi:bark storage protein A isoform X2 [Manihot esculenta]|uniref:bark storage protein A isoform X2 n=1 Tax=Manihot esculenta TaxID=3983 RepID=UPI001CC71CF6|nr:bark storage protein A isoform X2 [Manihot esculenta]